MENTFIVRDMRVKEKFFVDDEYLNGYAKHLGVSASCVYFLLCRHADKDQSCFPSQELISEKLGITTRTVVTSIKKLEEWNIITKDRKRAGKSAKWLHNTYCLNDKTVWKSKPSENISCGDQVKKTTRPSEKNDINQVKPFHIKDTHKKDTHDKVLAETSSAEVAVSVNTLAGKEWNNAIDSFKDINPLWEDLYRNKAERSALQHLADKLTKQKLLNLLTRLPEIVSMPYAPRITKPTELKRDLGKLVTFMKQQGNTSNKYQVKKIH